MPDLPCAWCDELVSDELDAAGYSYHNPSGVTHTRVHADGHVTLCSYHRECRIRSALGSVGHAVAAMAVPRKIRPGSRVARLP